MSRESMRMQAEASTDFVRVLAVLIIIGVLTYYWLF